MRYILKTIKYLLVLYIGGLLALSWLFFIDPLCVLVWPYSVSGMWFSIFFDLPL